MDDFFVEICFTHETEPRVAVITFNQHNHRFDLMLDALPVDLDDLLHRAV